MRHHGAQVRVVGHAQAGAVAVGAAAHLPAHRARGGVRRSYGPPRLLHLAARRPPQRAVVPAVAGREGVQQEGHPAGQVGHGAPQATHGGDGPVAQRRRLVDHPPVVGAPVPEGAVGVHRPGGPHGVVQAERPQEAGGDLGLARPPGGAGHQAAQQRVAQVRVLPRRAGRPGEPRAGHEGGGQLGVGDVEVAVGPRVVAGQPAAHAQQVAHRHGRRVGGGPLQRGGLGHVRGDGIVEPEGPVVAQGQHGGGREALRHRRDAEQRARPGHRTAGPVRPARYVGCAGPAGVHEGTVEHHAPRHARGVVVGHARPHHGVHGGDRRGVERRGPGRAGSSR